MAASLLGDKQTRDLPLHPRRDHDRTRLGQSLRPRSDVRHVSEYLACRVHDHRPKVDSDARSKFGLSGVLVFSVQLAKRALDRERGAHSALGVILLCHRVAEQRHNPITKLLGDLAAHLGYCCRDCIEISAN